MKRKLETRATGPPLPFDLLLVVAQCGEWRESGALARMSKATLRLFTRRDVLRRVVESCLARRVLLRWLLLALPGALLDEAPALPVVPELTIRASGAFVTGGAVSQRLYERKWDSDLDVWIEAPELERAVRDGNNRTPMDVIVARDPDAVERCIERFDMSVAQQGYTSGWARTAYYTALALYSWHERVLVALPSRQCIEYDGMKLVSRIPRYTRLKVNIWHYIAKHEANVIGDLLHDTTVSHIGPYHECQFCGDENTMSAGHTPFQPWRKRMATYATRYPDFKVVYCHAPDDTDPREPSHIEIERV